MSRTIIASNPTTKKPSISKDIPQIKIAEFFSRTIQGESISTGFISAFLRTKNCTLNCSYCDSTSVWRYGDSYSIPEVLDLMEKSELVQDLEKGHHLVLTGGSPLMQQEQLYVLLHMFKENYGFLPYVEVENECVLSINEKFSQYVAQWNNSPKLQNSEMKKALRYKPEVIKEAAQLYNSWFKFVISEEKDWNEIVEDYLEPNLIRRNQIVLMPCGSTREELLQTQGMVVDMAIRESVIFSNRSHVQLWDKMVGV